MPASKPISKEKILEAHSKTKSNRAAARFLGCSYVHYKRYAKLYKDENGKTLFETRTNRSGKGIPKFLSKKGQVGNIIDVIEGRVPIEHFTPQKIRDKLIAEGYLIEECVHCKWHERRISDFKMPLIMNFKDGNKKNYALNNLELLCYNCYFIYVGNVFTEKQITHMEDYVPTPVSQEVDWEMDKSFEEHFKQLGLIDKKEEDKSDGSEYISRLKK